MRAGLGLGRYKEKVDTATQTLASQLDQRGLYTQFISPISGHTKAGVITLGARVDSVYEYRLSRDRQHNTNQLRTEQSVRRAKIL